MKQPPNYYEAADQARAKLIAGVAEVERQLSVSSRAPEAALRASWASLVRLLDLQPPAQTRLCPHCEAVSMRAATRCGTCWSRLDPLPDEAAAPVIAGGLSDF